MESRRLDAFTAENQAEQARFDCLVSLCTYMNNERVFKNVDEYLEKAGEDWAVKCARALNKILYPDTDENWEMSLPENKFLKANGLINENGDLINKEGHLVDENMRLINDDGRLVDESGNLVNHNGETENNYTDYENDLWQS